MARQQLVAAEQAQASLEVDAGRLAAIRDGLGSLRDRIAQATPAERQELVRALVAPGRAVFHGRQVRLTLRVELEERDTVRPSLTVVQACDSG